MNIKLIISLLLILSISQMGCGSKCPPSAEVTGVDEQSGVTIITKLTKLSDLYTKREICVYDQLDVSLTSPSGKTYKKSLNVDGFGLFSVSQSTDIISWFPQDLCTLDVYLCGCGSVPEYRA